MFAGVFIGTLLGQIIGIPGDIGGVGFAMLLLMLSTEYLDKKGIMTKGASSGIAFWSAMYIPVVVAMAASQNVYAAISGGPTAIIAGVLGCVVMFPLIRPLSKLAKVNENWEAELDQNN
jgi:malonate transporter MadL subunit